MKDFVSLIESAGVIGAGGAGFPSHVKFNANAEYVLVNGAECEPLLRVDQQLMTVYAKEMLEGLNACVEAVGAHTGIIGLKRKYKDAIAALNSELSQYPKLRLHLLENVYPAGDEQYLVYELTGRIVPEGGIPLKVATIVTNVETLINVYRGLKGQAVTRTFLTIAGAVRRPMTLEVPVGIALETLIAYAGGATIRDYKVIDGGPMMGKVIDPKGVVVSKTSKGFIILPSDHSLIVNKEKSIESILKEAKTSCCHCDLCTDVCPRYLLGHKLHPAKLMRIASYGSLGDHSVSMDEAFLCCECGLCEQVCIMNLQPWKLNAYLKNVLSKNGVKNSNNREVSRVNIFKEFRGFPVSKLVIRLNLSSYDLAAPLTIFDEEFTHLKILSKQHIGKAGERVVGIGDDVTVGDIIYKIPAGALGSIIHAPISGKVVSVTDQYVELEK